MTSLGPKTVSPNCSKSQTPNGHLSRKSFQNITDMDKKYKKEHTKKAIKERGEVFTPESLV